MQLVRWGIFALVAVCPSQNFLWGQAGAAAALPAETGGRENGFVAGGAGPSISLEEAQQLALEGNATLRSERLSLEASRREAQSRWNAFLPGISLGGSISNNHGITAPTSSSWSWSASGGLSLSLTAGIPVQMQLAALRYEIAEANYQNQVRTILSSVARSFYNLLTSTKNLSVLEDNVALTRRQYEQARLNYNRGLTSELDMLRAQYAALSAEPQLEQARSQYESDLAAFCLLIGSQEKFIPAGEFQLRELGLPDSQALAEGYLENRLDVIQKRRELREAELARTSQALSARAPSISLSESVRMGPAGGGMDGDPSVSGSFSVGVSIPVDGFIPGSAKSLAVKKAGDTVAAAQISLETTVAQARQDIVAQAKEVELLWHAVEIAKLNETIAERAYQLSQEGYRAGLVSQTDMEDSRQQMVSAQLAGSTSQSQYLVGVESLANALGLTMDQVYELFGVEETEHEQ